MKFLRYIQKKRRAIFALAALTLFSSPFSAQASTITAKDSSHDKTITFKNNVYNIAVQKKLSNTVGVNEFKNFDLDKGQIANMQFDKLQTVANLVDNKININGTVNALRDGKIGGNLYFLSPNGIAVGSSGVINAGAFTGMAVSQSYFDKLSKIESGSEFMTALAPKNIEYNNSAKNGIDIQGVINAPGGIHLYATKIDIGTSATLRTDVSEIDFTKVVNVEGVDSGITGGLDASYKDGNIVLKAYAEHVADDNNITNFEKWVNGEGTSTRWEKVTESEATINVDGTIKSAGDVSINAEAVTTFSEGSYFNIVNQSGMLDALLGGLGFDCSVDFAKKTNKATVNIKNNADIQSKGNMDIGATGTLNVTINATTPAVKSGTTKATDWIPATSVAVISATNKATVNIDGKLKSDGTMAINAKAITSLSATANTATVVGKSSGEEGIKEDTHYIAVSVIDGETSAEVNINSNDEIIVGGSDSKDAKAFSATAKTENTISNSATAATAGTSVGSTTLTENDDIATTTAVDITDYSATANVNVNRAITAQKGGINLDATNTFKNSLTASTTTGRAIKPIKDWTEVTGSDFLNSISSNLMAKATSFLQKAAENVPEGAGGSTLSKLFDGKYFKSGVTVGVFLQNNNAKVNVDKKATLNAQNDIDISAKNDISSQAFNVTSSVNNQTSKQKTNAMIGLGVLVSDITNNADIVNDGKLNSTSGNVKLETTSGMNYNQFEAVVDSVKKAFTDIADDVKNLGEDIYNTFSSYESQVSEEADKLEKTEDPAEYMQALENLNKKINDAKAKEFNAAVEALDDGVKLKTDLEGLPSKLTAFLHPANYANYYARSSFGAGADGNKDVKLEAAGSFSINSMLNNSRIISGENSVITAENGAVNTNSLAQNRVVAITGMGGEHLTSSEAQNSGAGISVFVGNFKNNAVTAFGKNSQIKSKDIKLETKDYAKHVNIIYGNGKADSTSITGMVSYIKSPANSVLALDDSTKLNGSGKVELNALSENYITSVNGAITMGNGNGKSFGAAINVLSNDGTTSVMVADNGVNSSLSDNITNLQKDIENATDQNIIIDKKTELKTLKIAKTTQDILGDDYTKKLGDSSADTGEISADTFNTKAENTGIINSIAVEGTENSESHRLADKFNGIVGKGETQLSYVETAFKWPANKLSKMLGNTINDKFKSGQPNANDAANQAGEAAGNEDGGAGANAGVDSQAIQNQLNVAGAGSAAINIKSGETGSLISNSNINAKNIDVSANDDSFNGSWAGAGAFNFFGNSQAAKNTNVAIGGAVAYSDNSKNVDSIIKNSTINNAASIKNTATRDDSDVAAAMGLAVSTNSGNQGNNVDVAVSASINFVEGDTHALLLNNTVKGGTLENKAAIDSLQVAGGLDIAGSSSGGKGFNIGGSAAASKITNDMQSGIKGGSYGNLSKVDITADKKSNQIDVAVAGGVTAGGNSKGFAFGGAVAVSDINNNSRAFLNDTTKFQSSGVVNVDALDSKNENNRNEYLSSRSINTDPTDYLDSSDKSKFNADGGGNIVNVAFGAGGSTSEAAAGGLGISYAGVSNLVNVDISNNQAISAQNLKANTTNKSNIVDVTVGLAGSNKSFSAAGSFGVSDIKNDATINIKNSNVTTTNDFLSEAQSKAHIVNIAGQAALADKFSGGLTFAYNAMNNTTGINVSGGNWNVKNFGATATNDNYALAIGAGVGFSKETGALNGSIGLNMGSNSTKAIVDGSTITGAEKVNVAATDKTSKTTVAGGLTLSKSGKVAAGGAVAYANIGSSDNKEVINAKITNATVSAKNIDVEAKDKATMTTVGVGVGGALSGAKVTFQGAAAVSELNKENVAEISNSTISNNPDIKIEATSGGNTSDGLKIDDKKIDVNNKVNTAAAALDVNFSDKSWFDGALAISVNNFNQTTEANFKNTSRPETVSNVGNVNMYSNSEGDLLGIAIGGTGGKSKVSASGSVSYNYIDNSAKSLAENLNLDADKNFGVVAQSDDKIANYAGAVDVNVNGGYGAIGVSVAYNEIKGNTDANIKGSKLEVAGSDSDLIAISNPSGNLIDNYVTKNVWTSGGLMSGRTTGNKSGLVVNSSATHTISSDLATVGIRASTDKPGVGISGTVNINKISGQTNAKVENTNVDGNTDTFVNAADYTNNGSFVGNAAVSGTVAVGVLWNENQVERETNSLVDGGTLNVKNLDVKADSRQGLSNLNIAVGASFAANKKQMFAAASGDNIVRNQMEGTTTAKIENATVNHSGAVDVNAYHKDNAYATNLAVGAAIDMGGSAGATFDLGYGLMRENSTVNAEINNSKLTGKTGAVKVNAENSSKIAGAFGTAGIAVHAGSPGVTASVAVGINNNYITDNVTAGINNSTLDVGAVDVNAKNTSEIKADGGVAAVAMNLSKTFFASMGAAVAVTNATFDNKVTAQVDNSTITAAGDVNINARDDHKSDETVVAAALSSGVAVDVNRMSTSINSGLANLQKDDLGKPVSAKDLMDIENPSKENASSASDKLTREYGSETRFINEDTINSLLGGVHTNSSTTKKNLNETLTKRYTATVNYNNSLKNGVFASVTNGSTIDAGTNNISINSTENNDLSITSGGGNAALIAGIGVGSTSIEARRANTANVTGSKLKAKNIDISTTNGQTGSDGILSKMYNATLSPVGVSVGYNNVETNGTSEILISNANITATGSLNATATDNSKSKSYILDAGIKQVGYTGVFAYNTNTSQTGIEVSNKSTLTAPTINFNSENHSHRATDTLAISISGTLGVQTSTSEANDTSKNFINVKGAGNTFSGDTLTFNALNGAQTYAYNNGQAYVGLNAIVANGLANSENNSAITIADANTFANKTINITAQVGEDGKNTAQAEGFAINASTVGVNIDNMTAQTKSTAAVNIGNQIYGDDTTLNVSALNKASRDAFMRNNAYAVVANANDISSYTIAEDSSSIAVGSDTAVENANKLTALNITSDSENKSYVAAKGTGGAIGGDFGSAAHADNSVNNTSSATLNGTWNIADALTMSATQHDGAYITGYSARGAILTGGEGSLDNVIKGSSTATISKDANINAKTVNVNAKNYIKTDKYSDEYDYTLYGLMIGLVDDVDDQRSIATTNKSANINIGKNATITTTGKQIYDAASDYNLKNEVYAEGGSALASLRWVKSRNYITADEKISVGTGAILKNEGGTYDDGGITLAAHDNLEHNPFAKGNAKAGAGGYVRAETLTDLTRNQTIEINGTLKSAKDLNLYAGADINGDSSKVHSYARATSQVMTLVDDGGADIIRKGKTNANVNVNSGAYGEAAHNVNVISNAGFEAYEEKPFYGSTWKSRGKYSVVTSDVGNLTTSDYKHSSLVKVDGELKAANTPDVTINISGVALPDDFILASNKFKNLSYNVKSGDVTITEKNEDFSGMTSEQAFAQRIYNGISTSTVDYANEVLKTRYEAVCKEIANFQVAGREDVATYNGFLQEKLSLESEMEKLGLGSYIGGEFKLDSSASINIKTVVLPDVEVSGGNINVVTNDLTGTGKLNASGVPKIDIENNSTAYLVANKLTIADKGGAINYNDKGVSSNAAINDINVSKSGAAFSDMSIAPSAAVPTIKVANNYSGQTSIPMKLKPKPNDEEYKKLSDDAKKATLQYTPINYIEVAGNVTNPVGKVLITNKQGSIRINKGALVNGMDIEITAKESISQGYTEGIVNIAYRPQDADTYKAAFAKMLDELGWNKSMPTKDQIVTKTSDDMYTGGVGMHAGEAIYISARDININGLIQSGYESFEASVSQKDIDNATEMALFNGVTMYKVNDGGYKLDEKKGYYVYEPQVYYDKASNQLYVEDINATGGKVYLAGRISSTGNGKIVVSDGASNIDVKNNTTLDMNIGKVTSSQGEGLIQIADSEQDKLTEYSSGQTRTIENYSAWLANNAKGKVTTGDGLKVGDFVNYNPQSGLTYSWSAGTSKEQTEGYHYKETRSWWGLSGDSNYTSDLAKMSAKLSPSWSDRVKTTTLDTNEDTYYISTQNKVEHNLTLFAQNVKTKESYGNHTIEGPEKHGFAGFYRDYTHRWKKDTGSKQIYQYSIKADYPISVGIIGEKNPHINLTNASTSGGDLYLTGNIRNDNATLNIRTNGGKIEQSEGVTVATDNINLSARTGIKNIDLTNHRTDDLKLNARTSAGDIDVNVTGGIYNNKKLAGNVIVDALKSEYGGVMLTAQGDIKQTISGASVNAQNIKLESTDGAINLKIQSNGQSADVSAISAAANGNINLTKTDENDFLIGSIVSTNGDVTLTANGKFIDALDKVRDNGSTDESDLVKSWIDMGLIAGTDDYKGAYVTKLEQDRDAYKADITEKFTDYTNLKAAYQKDVANYELLKAELDSTTIEKSERLEELEKKFGDATTVSDDLATEFEEYQLLKTTYEGAVENYNNLKERVKAAKPAQNDRLELLDKKFSEYNSAEEYLAADSDYQTLVETAKNPQYQWTKDELLAGIRSSIVNKEEGSDHDTTRLKDANITGKNITLTGAGVGSNVKKATTIKMSELRVKANETAEEKSARLAKLSQLANVNAADVTVNYVLDTDGNPVMQTVTQVTYNYDADKGYYIDTAGNYVRYRKDVDGNLLKYTYDANLKQVGDAVAVAKDSSGNYDFSDVIKSTKTIENKGIESFNISGTIPLGIYATGNITVDTNGNNGIYIASRNKGVKITETTNPNNDVYSPLNVNKIETTKADGNFADVRLTGEKGIFNAADSGANVIAKDLILVGGDDSIGTQKRPFAVQLTGDLLNARSNNEVNLQKFGTNNFRVSSVYSPKAIRITNNEYGIIEYSSRYDDIAEAHIITPGEITLTGSSGTPNFPLSIKASESTVLNLEGKNNYFYIKGISGTMNLNDIAGNVDISSDNSIGQTQDGKNSLKSIKVAATGDVILDGTKNKLNEVYLGAIGGNFELKNNSSKLTATFAGTIKGSATINQTGDINLGGSGIANILNLTSEKGDITSTGGLKATKEINLSVGTFTHEGEIHTDKLTIATDNGLTINNPENTFNTLVISSRDGNAINGSIDVAIKADKFAPTIKNDVKGDVTLENTKTSGAMSFGSGEAINVGGTFTATTLGDFDYGSTLNAGKGISIDALNIYRRADTTGYFSTTGRLLLNSQNSVGTAKNPILIGNHAEKVTGLDIYGKGIYVNGVNSGILTLGDIIGTSFNVNSEGAIAQADNKKLNLTDKVEVSAADDVTLDNAENVINKVALNGGDNVKVHSIATNGLTVEGDLKTGGDVTITAEKSLTLNGTIDTEKNISLTAGKSTENTATDVSGTEKIDVSKPDEQKEDTSPIYALTSSKASALKAGEQITLNAGNVKLLGKVETAAIETTNAETESGIKVTTRKGLDMQNAANNFEALSIESSDGEQINGSILATSNSEGVLVRIDDAITGNLTLTNKNNDGVILMQGYGKENNILDVKGNVTLDMGGEFAAGRAIHSSGDINITSRNAGMFITSIDSKNNILEATKNLTLKAAKNIDIDGNITAGNNITINSAGIDVFGQANMEAGNNINLTSKKGDIKISSYVPAEKNEIKGSVSAKQGTIKMTVDEGDIQIGNEIADIDTIFAKKSITLKTDKGNIDVKGSMTSDNGTAKMTITNGGVDITGKLTANKVDIELGEGNIQIGENSSDADTLVSNGNITLKTDKGDIDITGSTIANKGNVAITLTNGNVDITGSLRAERGKIDVEIGSGNIQVGNETTKQNNETVVFAKGDINMKTGNGKIDILGNHDSEGDIKFETNPKAENVAANIAEFYSYDGTPVLFAANVVETDDIKKPGDITIDAELKANNSVSITTTEGDIEVTKKITVTNGDITIATSDGNIIIDSNGADDMVRAQNDLNIRTDEGAVDIAGKISTKDGDITITSNHNSYTAGQKGIIVEETGAINPGKNVYLNATNGDIEFKNISAQNANINSSSGNVTADTINAADTVRIALERGDLYLNLARSKGVAVLTGDTTNSTVNTIQANSVDVSDAVTVGKVLPYRSNYQLSASTTGGGATGSGSSTSYNSYSNNYSNVYSNAYSSGYSNFASNPSSFATLGTTFTNDGLTYWQNATSSAASDYSFSEFNNTANDMSYRQTRNYFEVKFIPTWLEKEFMSIDFDYSFDNFGIKNATEDELTID